MKEMVDLIIKEGSKYEWSKVNWRREQQDVNNWTAQSGMFRTPSSVQERPEVEEPFRKAHAEIKRYFEDIRAQAEGTLASPSWESNLSPHNSNIVGTDRRGDYGYKACSDCKGPVALDSWGEPDESCQSCNTGGDPTNQSVEGQTVRQMTGHTGEVEYDEFGEIEPSSLTEDDWEEREKEKEEEIIRNAQQHDGEATRHGGDVCPTCDGMGEVNADGTSITAFGNEQQDGGTFKCDTCNGTGEIESTV
jgi:hypothetical protein